MNDNENGSISKNDRTLLEAAIDLCASLDRVVDKSLPQEIANIVKFHSKGAAAAALAIGWLPAGAGSIAAQASCGGFIWTMYGRINSKIGVSLSKNILKTAGAGILTNLAAAAVSGTAVSAALSLIPGIGSIGASAVVGATSYAMALASGIMCLKILTKLFKAGQDPSHLSAEAIKKEAELLSKNENLKDLVKSAAADFETAEENGELDEVDFEVLSYEDDDTSGEEDEDSEEDEDGEEEETGGWQEVAEYFIDKEDLKAKKSKPFLMPIEDVFNISGRGTVVVGKVDRGILKVNDEVEIVGIKPTKKTVATSLEMFNKTLDDVQAGENVGILLQGIAKKNVKPGQVLAKPGSISAHTKFDAHIYMLSPAEGGREDPVFTGYRPQFYIRTTDISGTVTLPKGVEMVRPGHCAEISVEIIVPIALEKGLVFALREDENTVAIGKVTKIIK